MTVLYLKNAEKKRTTIIQETKADEINQDKNEFYFYLTLFVFVQDFLIKARTADFGCKFPIFLFVFMHLVLNFYFFAY